MFARRDPSVFPHQVALFLPEVEEIRVSPVVSRRGYLNFLEEKKGGWHKRWVVSILGWDWHDLRMSCLVEELWLSWGQGTDSNFRKIIAKREQLCKIVREAGYCWVRGVGTI